MNVVSSNKTTALISAAGCGSVESLQLLLKAGADVNTTDFNGVTSLIAAALSGSLQCVKLLLTKGAHVNRKTNYGNNALAMSILYNSTPNCEEMTRLLFAAGETLDDTVIDDYPNFRRYLDSIKSDAMGYRESKLCLLVRCRDVIRRHLLALNRHLHLFGRVRQLGLPSPLASYLLYDVSLNFTDFSL